MQSRATVPEKLGFIAAFMAALKRARAQWIARCVVGLVVAGSALCTIMYEFGAEHFGFLSEIQYLPYPIFLAPALVAFALSFALGRAWRVASLLGLVLVATVVMGFEFHTGDPGTDRIRVMTFNIKGYLTLDRPEGALLIAYAIALHDPDLVMLQDANDLMHFETRSPGALKAVFGDRHVFSHGEYVIASRLALRDCKAHPVPIGRRYYAHIQCVVNANGVEVDVITAHFMSPRKALNAAREQKLYAIDEWQTNLSQRILQAEAVTGDVLARKRPVIFAGDLNAPERSLVVRNVIAAGLRDTFSAAGKGYGYTYGHSLRPGISFLRIDHILVSSEIGVADCFVGGDEASPHRPVIADLYLNRGRG